MYSEAQRRATQKYREKVREHVNQLERKRYARMKETEPEKYKQIVERSSIRSCLKSKERTEQNRFVRSLMCISIS